MFLAGQEFRVGGWFEFKAKSSSVRAECPEELTTLSVDHPPTWPSPLYIIFVNPAFLSTFFYQYHPNEIQDKY